MKILITGANGMLAQATIEHCRSIGDDVAAFTREQLDIGNRNEVLAVLEREKCDTVINCAAWTDVDGCETNPEKNFQVNALGVENLAVGCRNVNANLVTISTDYVFDGLKDGFYTQRDDPNPTSEYGRAKLEGERLAQTSLARTIIVRSGWIFGANGKNFLSKVVEKLLNGESVKGISDTFGTPTYAPDLSKRLRDLAVLDLPGVYHITNSGEGTSYAGFARTVLRQKNVGKNLVEDVAAMNLKRPAPRPNNSRLRCLVSEAIGLQPLPFWETALRDYVEKLNLIHNNIS